MKITQFVLLFIIILKNVVYYKLRDKIVNTEKCGFSGMEHAIGRLE